jgi:hypothetical protein
LTFLKDWATNTLNVGDKAIYNGISPIWESFPEKLERVWRRPS